MNSISRLIVITSVATLAACVTTTPNNGGDEDNTLSISAAEEALRLFAETESGGVTDVGGLIASGEEVHARSAAVAAKVFDFDDETSQLSDASISMSGDGDTLTLTMNGQTFELDPSLDETENPRQIRYSDDSGYRDIFILSADSFDEAFEGANGFAELYNAFFGGPDSQDRVYFVLGAETTDEALQALSGSVDYTGQAEFRIDPSTDWVGEPTSSIVVFGGLTLSADFDSQSVSGEITDMFVLGDDFGENVDGAILLNETQYSINGFEGTLSVDESVAGAQPVVGSLDDGAYSGVFYGPNGEEVGGVMSAEGTVDGQDYNAVGGFHADN